MAGLEFARVYLDDLLCISTEQGFDKHLKKLVLDGQIADAQEGDVRVGSSRRRKMSKEKICGGLLWNTT
jgi:hypothetical protein